MGARSPPFPTTVVKNKSLGGTYISRLGRFRNVQKMKSGCLPARCAMVSVEHKHVTFGPMSFVFYAVKMAAYLQTLGMDHASTNYHT
eukprot:SAG31_NODE_2389_length_5806_cov_3.020151_6_plen_87_part_00